jgi:dinuclear metal center YbgI/SA1388 family protein
MIKIDEIVSYLDSFLNIDKIKDSSCNGLQIEGNKKVEKIALAVDACLASYKKAIAYGCQMLIVHHGLIWNGIKYICGYEAKQIEYLLKKKLNLYAAHLPLDIHSEIGNSVTLAKIIGLTNIKPFGEYNGVLIGCEGILSDNITLNEIGEKYKKDIRCNYLALPFGKKTIKKVAIVSGSGSSALKEAVEKKIECFITGEPKHSNYHVALESKINILYLGHYHSEKTGIIALGKKLEKEFNIKTIFIDIPTII